MKTLEKIKPKEYYNMNGVIVRPSTKKDAEYLKDNLCPSDVREIWSSHHLTPEEALDLCVEKSLFALTIEDEGEVIAMFGINPDSILGYKASIWMLSSSRLHKRRIRFLKHSRRFIDMMLDYYPYLENYVDDRNQKSIEWLRFCGATVEEPMPYGMDGAPFRHFYFERKNK